MPLIVRSVITSVLVFLGGFVALAVYWSSAPQSGSLRGLYDYPSAVWGDGLALPALAGALTYSVGQLPPPKRHLPAAVAAILGLLAGWLLIVRWVSDPNPDLNWTMPAPHQFNDAGKWHAGFLIIASGLFAALWVEFLHRLKLVFRTASTRPLGIASLRSGPFALIVGTTFGYAFLAGIDSARVGTTSAGLSSLIALIGAALLVVGALTWAVRSAVRYAMASTTAGVILAIAFVLLGQNPPATFLVALLTAMAVAAGLSFAMTAEPCVQDDHRPEDFGPTRGSPALEWLAIPALFGIVPLLVQTIAYEDQMQAAAIVLVAFALTISFRSFRRREWSLGSDSGWFLVAAIYLIASYGILVMFQVPDLAFLVRPALLALTALALSQIALVKCKTDYARLKQMELTDSSESDEGLATPNERAEKRGIWGRISSAGVAAALAIISLTVSVAPAVGWRPATGEISLGFPSAIIGAAGLAILACAFPQIVVSARRRSARTESTFSRPRTFAVGAIYVGCTLVVISGVLPWVDDPGFHHIAALQALLIAMFTVACVLGNGVRLHLVPVTRATVGLGLFTGAANFVVIYWALTKGVGSTNATVELGQSLLSNAGAMCLVAIVTVTATATAYVYGRTVYLTQYTPVTNSSQDVFLVSLLWLVFAWMPQTVAEHLPRDDPYHLEKVLIIVLSIVGVGGKTLLWILGNNDTHAGRERTKAGFNPPPYARDGASLWLRIKTLPLRISAYFRGTKGPITEYARYDAIDGHTAIQNAVALSLMVVTLVGLAPALIQFGEDHAQRVNLPDVTL